MERLNRQVLYHALLVAGWMFLVVYGYHLEVRFFAAFSVGVNLAQCVEEWKKKNVSD